MELTTVMVAAFIVLVLFFWFRRADPRLPPCPMRPLPILGHLLYMSEDPRPQFKEWRKQCGDIYSLYMGGSLVVVLNGYDLIKEALVKKADVMSDRPPLFIDLATGITEKGITFSSGHGWKEKRSASLSILRTFGMGKNVLADKIREEVDCYVNYLASFKGKASDIQIITNISASNIICSILIGHRFDYDDKEFQNLIHKMVSILGHQGSVSLVNYFFWLRKLPGDFFRAKKIISGVQAAMSLLKNFIDEKRRHVVDSNDVYNLIDAYMIERNKKIQAGLSTSMDLESLPKVLFELFLAGTETSSTTIYWFILYVLNNPGVQEKLYQEIKTKIGTDRTPTIQDKSQLVYLNAAIMETQRLASIVPHSVSHVCSEEVTMRGYTLPKGTQIIPNLDSVLYDETTWGDDVMNFRPERFIEVNGKLKIPEEFIPFGIGRRVCLGQSLAKMELFLFLSSMFQKFEFLPPTPGSVPKIKYEFGMVISPKPYEVRIIERK